MVKMHDIRRTAADVKAEKKASGKDSSIDTYVSPEDDGARFELGHDHLTKMGINGDLKSGDTVQFHGHGTVERSESRSTPDGEKHSATLRLHRGGIDHEPKGETEAKGDLRNDLETAADRSAERGAAKKAGGK